MKEKKFEAKYTVFPSLNSLMEIDQKLLRSATDFLKLSYAPYSQFKVAAAILLENGEIISGANQENSSYPLCLCAERVALHHAAMRFPEEKIVAMAITARNQRKVNLGPIPPCGACRQVIAEYERKLNCEIKLILKGELDEVMIIQSINDILPFSFNRDYLLY